MARTDFLLGIFRLLDMGQQVARYGLEIDHLRLEDANVKEQMPALVDKNVIVEGDIQKTKIYQTQEVPYLNLKSVVLAEEGFPKNLKASSIFKGKLTFREHAPASDKWFYMLQSIEVLLDVGQLDVAKFVNEQVKVIGWFEGTPVGSSNYFLFKVTEIGIHKGLTELADEKKVATENR